MSSHKGADASSPTLCLRGLSADPSSTGLDLAVTAGNRLAATALLTAMAPRARMEAAERAASKWQPTMCTAARGDASGAGSSSSGGDTAVLKLLLDAGANPFTSVLPKLLPRYERSVQVVHQQPFYAQPNACRSALAAVLRSRQCRAAAAAASTRPGCTPEHWRQLLLAAVFTRDERLCCRMIEGAGDACWAAHAANCHLLVAAAEHDLPAVLTALLAVHTSDGGQPFRIAPLAAAAGLAMGGGMAHEGCTPLMAAAERNSCAALRLLLGRGAALSAVDEDGVSALHWAVIGGAHEAAELLLHAGASPIQPCTSQPHGLHLERPLLIAVKEGDCRMASLLLAHGAQLAAPTERGCTPLSVALAFEQVEAASLLLSLGAGVQPLTADLNAGRFRDASLLGGAPPQPAAAAAAAAAVAVPPPAASYASLVGLAASRRQQAAPLLGLLLAAGASADVADSASTAGEAGMPLAEAAAAGSVQGVAHLLRWAGQQHLLLPGLGWAAAAEAAARRSLASDGHHELLCLLLDAWQRQREQQPRVALPPPACAAIVGALLEAHSQQQAGRVAAGQDLDGACELQAVLLAERLAELSVSADLTPTLDASPHNRSVALAAVPPRQRWSHRNHRFFPPAFKTAACQLLLVAARQQQVQAAAAQASPPDSLASPASLASLPGHLVHHIIQLASTPLSFWLNHRHNNTKH